MKNRNFFIASLLFAGASLLSSSAMAQEFLMHQGGVSQPGKHDASQTVNYPGRAFLRWWDPLFSLSTIVDQWQPTATAVPPGSFSDPGSVEAGLFEVVGNPVTAPYFWGNTVPSRSFEDFFASNVATNEFRFGFNSLAAGSEYALAVNIPIGPTDVDLGPATLLRYQARYQVYRIDGVVNTDNPGQPIYERVDVLSNGGGWVPLGNSGAATSRVYTAIGTSIIISLINTIVRDAQGNLVDNPGEVIVYADAARASEAVGSTGVTLTSPIVARMKATTSPYPWRVFGTRMESVTTVDNNRIKDYSFPTITSYTHNAEEVIPGDSTGRRNMIWSWPALRPTANSSFELDRYSTERQQWLEGTGKYPGPQRFDQSTIIDNTNGNVTRTAGFVNDSNPNSFGADHFSMPSPGAVATDNVTFRPFLAEGDYSIEVFVPGGATAQGVEVEVLQGAAVISRILVNQSIANGWVRLSGGGISRWGSTNAVPLSVRILNSSTTAGEPVIADAVRLTKTANLGATSTPVFATIDINDGGTTVNRDVVFVALENGKIYCLDAAGVLSAGVPTGDTRVYWTYPSETAINNDDPVEGVSEKPAGFDFSSPLVVTINTTDYLFIGTTNGRVYCFEAGGNGTGTATRRWTYPDDFPATSVASPLGRIGTLSYAVTAEGPTIFVPTQQGRLYALDALGVSGTGTTFPRWTYPSLFSPHIGPISMAPVLAFNQIFFGTGVGPFGGSNTFFALSDTDTNVDTIGDLLWSTNTIGGQPLNPFGIESPVAVSSADMGGTMPNSVFFGNSNFFVGGFNAINGTELWSTDELRVSPSSSLGFTYIRTNDIAGNLRPDPGTPMIMVPTIDGRYNALYAETSLLNASGNKLGWTVSLSAGGFVPPMAFGARDTSIVGLRDDEYSWMYGSDPQGYLYAFNFDPDFGDGGQTISPGDSPAREEPGGDDNLSRNLGDIVDRARVSLLTPGDYEALLLRQRSGTLNYTDITAVANRVTRRSFEYGETLYMVAYDLADSGVYLPPTPYNLVFSLNTPGQSVSSRNYSVIDLASSPSADRDRATLIAFPLVPSGSNAMIPGMLDISLRVTSTIRNGANRTIPRRNFQPSQDPNLGGAAYNMSNPLAVSTGPSPVGGIGDLTQIGFTTDAKDNEAIVNGNNGKTIIKGFSPDFNSAQDNIAHGNTAVSRMFVWDRSLLTLLFGPNRGLQSVRMQLDDLQWLSGSPLKSLSPTTYPGLEDLPGSPGNNRSLDYPDIRRDRMDVTKSVFGAVENPLFQAVSLVPPFITVADQNTYNTTPAGYNDRLVRRLVQTTFDFSLDLPKFQPPSPNGYANDQVVYVDTNAPGFQPPTGSSIGTEAYRQFDLLARVAADERIRTNTPTLDLQSLPSGAGIFPTVPWANPAFRLTDPIFHDDTRFPFFQRFDVRNEGNVNLLNLRVAKLVDNSTGGGTSNVIFNGGDALSPRAQIQAISHLHTDLDRVFLGFMPNQRAILQKARPGDGEGTRLRVNPRRRANPNLDVNDGDFVPSTAFGAGATIPFGDSIQNPRLGVSIPFGAPVGQYSTDVDVIEDPVGGADPTFATWDLLGGGVYEPASDDPIQVRFEVRENRLTTSFTNKSAPMLDLTAGTNFSWTNSTPTATVTNDRVVMMAFSSDRILTPGGYSFSSPAKPESLTASEMKWRIYVATLAPTTTNPVGNTGMGDLSNYQPNVPGQWMIEALDAFPTATPAGLFNVPNAQIALDSNGIQAVSYTNPVFPAMGEYEPTGLPGANGRTARGTLYMAFTGELMRKIPSGERVRESRLFITRLNPSSTGTVTSTVPVPLEVGGGASGDGTSRFGRPSLVQVGNRATAFYALTSGSSSQLCFSYFDGTAWVVSPGGGRFGNAVQTLNLSTAFESVTSPSVTARPYVGSDSGRRGDLSLEMSFVGRLRGRSNPEAYFGRLRSTGGGGSPGLPQFSQGQWFVSFPTRLDALVLEDPSTGIYWVNGIQWMNNLTPTGVDNPLNPFSQSYIDVKRLNVVAGVVRYESILKVDTRATVEGSNLVTYDTVFGGKAYVDLNSGSVRFSGAIIPRNMKLYVRYAPRLIRVSTTNGINYRGVNMAFDDRYADTGAYYGNPGGGGVGANELYRNDRFVFTFGRSASANPEKSRPSMLTMRNGVQLPTPIATNVNGGTVSFNMINSGGAHWQMEPSSGKVYFNNEAEDRTVTIEYTGVDESGRVLPGTITVSLRVGLILEQRETNVPIQQVGNESQPWIGLGPLGGGSNESTGNLRKPNLLWFLWSSTRGGGSDIYFETVAPRWGSIVTPP